MRQIRHSVIAKCCGFKTIALMFFFLDTSVLCNAVFSQLVEVTVRNTAELDTLEGEDAINYAIVLYHGYKSNREKFQQYVCRYEMTVGSWESGLHTLEDALRGNIPPDDARCPPFFPERRALAEMLIARSKDVFLYRTRVPPDNGSKLVMPPRSKFFKEGSRSVTRGFCFSNIDRLSDATYFIDTNPLMGEKSKWSSWCYDCLGPWAREFSGTDMLEMTCSMLEELVRDPSRNELFQIGQVRVRRNVTLDGHTTSLLELTEGRNPRHLGRFWIDESRGYIPIRVESWRTDRLDLSPEQPVGGFAVGVVLEIRKVGKGWWPYHWVYAGIVQEGLTAASALTTPGKVQAIEGRVIDLQLRKPPKELLTITLPKGAYIGTNYDSGIRSIVLDEPMQVTVEDIPRLLARYYGEAEPPRTRKSSSITIATVSLAVLVSTSILAWVGYRWYRRRFG